MLRFTKIRFFFLLWGLLSFSVCPAQAETTKSTATPKTHAVAASHPKKIKKKTVSKKNKHRHHHQTHFSKNTSRAPTIIQTNNEDQPDAPTPFVPSVAKNLVGYISKTVTSLHYSAYKLGGKLFDTARGIYIVDCSSFVDRLLQKVSPHAYSSLVDASGAENPATQHYYEFFKELSVNPDSYWNKVDDVEQLQPGDILVFRYKNMFGKETGGHVMVVMDKPVRNTDVFFVRVADSASAAHSSDTRQPNVSGIGIGTLLLKENPNTGQPSAYAWGTGGYWNKNVKFAMARPIDIYS